MASDDKKTDRRRLLKSLGATSAFALAGCQGIVGNNSGGSQQGLGERVPNLVVEYWVGLGGFTSFWETAAPVVQDSLSKLGISAEITGTDYSKASAALTSDKRQMNITLGGLSSVPGRLDPHQMTRWFVIDWAGGEGNPNVANYASCEYSVPAMKQASARDQKERQKWVNQSQEVFSHDAPLVPVTRSDEPGAFRSDTVSPGGIGEAGVNSLNPIAYIKSTPKNKNRLRISADPTFSESKNHMISPATVVPQLYSRVMYSTLNEYDENYELQNVLMKNYEVSNDGTTYTVELIDGAKFHNGREIVAEDVVFTFKYLSEGVDFYPKALDPPYSSIKAVNDKTIEFDLESPYPSLPTKVWTQWGILPKQEYEQQGARKDQESWAPNPIIGSGPYQIDSFELGGPVTLTPADQQHPMYNPNHSLFFQPFDNTSRAGSALQGGDLDIAATIPMGTFENFQDVNNIKTVLRKSFLPFALYNQGGHPPTQFRSFRRSIAKVIDRKKINALAFRGRSKPITDTGMFRDNHPWQPPAKFLWKATNDPSGNREAARKELENAGWGWDDQNRLHYPVDADLSPRWPKGGNPDPENFACLSSENEFVMPKRTTSSNNSTSS